MFFFQFIIVILRTATATVLIKNLVEARPLLLSSVLFGSCYAEAIVV